MLPDYCHNTSLTPLLEIRKSGSLYLAKSTTAAARAAIYPILQGCAVCLCVQTVVWLPVFGILDSCAQALMRSTAHWGLYEHRKRVCTESWHGEITLLPHLGNEPASVLLLALGLTLQPLSSPAPDAMPLFFRDACLSDFSVIS